MSQPLQWQSEIRFLDNVIHPTTDLGDTLFTLDITARTPNFDDNIRGVTFDGTSLWIAGANAALGAPQIYQFDRNGNFLQTIPQPVITGNYFGFSNLVTDGIFMYGDLNNDIYVSDLQSGGLIRVTTLPDLSRIDAFTLDRSTLDYWATSWSEGIYQFDSNGALLSVFPYNGAAIGGLALEPDSTVPPKLWAWRAEGPAQGPMCTAVRLDSPAVQFLGVEMNGDPAANDMPAGVDIVRWGDKLTMLALQQSNYLPGDGHDFLVAYSLGKEWREWLVIETDTGTVSPNSQENIELTFYGIPGFSGERERIAVINFHTNDPLNPVISWNILLTITSSTGSFGSNNLRQKTLELYQNYPNPFNSGTTISYFLPVESEIRLNIYTVTGQRIRTMLVTRQAAGKHYVIWDARDDKGRDASSGLYVYQLTLKNEILTNKMLLLK